MDPKRIVKRSSLHRDIIAFFHENPSSIDTPRGISVWVRADFGDVRKVLDELVDEGILQAHKAPSTTGYSYTRNPRMISKIKKALKG